MTTLPDDDGPNNPHPARAPRPLGSALAGPSGTLGEGLGTLGENPPTPDLATQVGALVGVVAIGQQALARELDPLVQGIAAAERALEPLAVALSGFATRAQREAERVVTAAGYQQSPSEAQRSARRVMEAMEVQRTMRELATIGGPRGLRELQETRRALEYAGLLRREPSTGSAMRRLEAPPPPAPAPTPAELKREAAKQQREAAKQRRRNELRALKPRAFLATLARLRKGKHGRGASDDDIAANYGMAKEELLSLERSARAASRRPRKK